MSWKDISKSSYTLGVGKFAEWAPSHPFTIPYQGPKVRYSEGDEISSVTNPVFNVEFTGVPLSGQHFPCGYWHKNYIPPQTVIYTSLLYPLEVVDSLTSDVFSLITGDHSKIFIFYDIGIESISTSNFDLLNGSFSDKYIEYDNRIESIYTTEFDLLSGIFKEVLLDYDNGLESIETASFNLTYGIFRDALISYDDAEYESISTSSFNLSSGTFNEI